MPKPSSSRSLRGTAMRGVTLLFTANLASKLAGIATIYVTGRLLSKSDFALYAIAIAWGEIFGFMQNGGLHRLLLQRAKSFDNLYAPVYGLALAINGLWLLFLIALAPFVAKAYAAEEVRVLIILFGLSIPAGTVALLLRAYLMVSLRFGELSVLSVYSTLIRNGGVILLALAGLGPMSFILPVIVVGLFESVYLARKRPASWRPSFPGRRLLGALARPLFWIMASTLAMSLMTNGDYLVIGALQDKVTIGVYFFGFQLTVAMFSMFTQSLRSVFIPSFIALGDDRPRQENAFLRALEAGSLMLFFTVFTVAAVAQPMIGLVWSGKWDAAVPVVEIIAVASLARVVSPFAQSLLEARGAWRVVALMTWTEGLGLMASAAIGALLGGLFNIALSVGIYMILFGLLYIVVIGRHTALSVAAVARSVLGPYLLACGALALTWALGRALAPLPVLPEILVMGIGFAVIFALLILMFRRHLLHTVLDVVRAFRRKGDLLPRDGEP